MIFHLQIQTIYQALIGFLQCKESATKRVFMSIYFLAGCTFIYLGFQKKGKTINPGNNVKATHNQTM